MIQAVAARELQELERRERLYRGDRRRPDVRGRTVILVDDGLATGSTMRAAVAAVRRLGPARLIVAVPTAAPSTCAELGHEADECICVITSRSVLCCRDLVRRLLPDDRRGGPRPPRTGRCRDDRRESERR